MVSVTNNKSSERGSALVDYALLTALITLVAFASVQATSEQIAGRCGVMKRAALGLGYGGGTEDIEGPLETVVCTSQGITTPAGPGDD